MLSFLLPTRPEDVPDPTLWARFFEFVVLPSAGLEFDLAFGLCAVIRWVSWKLSCREYSEPQRLPFPIWMSGDECYQEWGLLLLSQWANYSSLGVF